MSASIETYKLKILHKIEDYRPGVLRYMGYISMCGPKLDGFSAVLIINRLLFLADFGHFGHKKKKKKQEMVFVL